ncbi:DNA translocase FtsK [Salicibibacter kimchii]|uniref:DNA translocase FtsK n=1 Tax=Salicibibacter kimchii TaxID=2099786 RepID=A0A345BYG9_9BACI|nr:DNA translocase FtsK [Salicibibacter kimchii]
MRRGEDRKKERGLSAKPIMTNQSYKEGYDSPPFKLLTPPVQASSVDEKKLQEQRDQLEATLHQFQVKAAVSNVTEGPSIIRFEVQPAPGVKVNKVTNLSDDLKLAMAATDLRMEAPIPGKNAIGIEVPKENREPVALRELFEKEAFQSHESPLAVALGLDITGSPIIMDLNSMPHGLIAGATGSGKSVCINSILISLLYKADPDEVKLLLIDPKVVELAFYKDIPHLAAPVVTDPKEAMMTLKWSVAEMERRYQRFAEAGVRDIIGYNQKAEEKMPYLVIVIDELADLMMVAPQDVETSISRIAQKARACGIHLLVATQRPSVDVITGLIKANIPTRIAFAVSSAVDSRTILDTGGAERLIGKGDMLLSENGASKLVRLQGTFVSDQEIDEVAAYLRNKKAPVYLFTKNDVVKHESRSDDDDLLEDASYFVIQQGSASTSLIQRQFHIGYNRAARLMDMMEKKGVVSAAAGTKSRDVLVSDEQLSDLFD